MTRHARDWSLIHLERTCRVCGDVDWLERAHVIPRRHDPPNQPIHPASIVTLCKQCHIAYDAHNLDLLPYLTTAEQAHAVGRVGLVAALRYISGRTRAQEIA